jgi:hypothetical protein
MPVKGTKLKYGNRDYIVDRSFYNKLVETTNTDLTYAEVSKIVREHTKNIAEVIEEEVDGFKLPKGLGYLCAIKYIPKKQPIDWVNTKKYGKTVYFTNFQSMGYSISAKLFRVGRPNNNSFYDIFMFKPCKKLAASLVHKLRAGKVYSDFTISDFIEKSRLENLYSKRYRKDLKK